MFDSIVRFFRSLNVELNDWQHMAWAMWLYILAWLLFGLNLWWIGVASGVVVELIQFASSRRPHLRDRVADAWGHSVTVTFALPSVWVIAGGLLWYLVLWAQRKWWV